MKIKLSNDKEFEIIRENFLSIQICANISPDEMEMYANEIEGKMPECGTSMGWRFVSYEGDYQNIKPVKCDDNHANYHYVLLC